MNSKISILCCYILLLSSCSSCREEVLNDKNIVWKNRICGKSLIFDEGMGYPIYKNTVVFHSTPEPWGLHQSILLGLDTENGTEKWRLTNGDFTPKKDIQFNCTFGIYQKDNIVIGCDNVNIPNGDLVDKYERYVYGIDIEKGKVLWVTPFPNEYKTMGNMIRGAGQYAYVNAKNQNKYSLLRVNIKSGELTSAIDLTNLDLPEEIRILNPEVDGFYFTDIYQNNSGDDLVALSLMSKSTINTIMLTLYVFNLTQNTKVYSTSVTLKEGSNAWIHYHEGKVLLGKSHNVYCFDAFENKKYWEKSVILNDGIGMGSGNDEIMKVIAFDNLALVYCVDRLVAFDINTGVTKYNVPAAGSTAPAIIDGIIYQRDQSDLQMRDPKTGKELKRVATGKNEQAFSSSRPNGANGRIFVHSYSDAYCIKAWGR